MVYFFHEWTNAAVQREPIVQSSPWAAGISRYFRDDIPGYKHYTGTEELRYDSHVRHSQFRTRYPGEVHALSG